MKKLLVALILLLPTIVSAYTIQKGDTLWMLYGSRWRQVAQENGIKDPRKLQIGQQIFDSELLGAGISKRPTEFKTSLAEQKTENHSDTTLKVTSITTKDDNTLSASTLGTLIVLSVNPGASNAETVVCTGLTTSTKTFTGCTFGYRFDDPTATSSTNIKPHSPGEPVIISNTDTYTSQKYLTVDGDNTTITATSNTISGLWTFTHTRGLCFVASTTLCIRGSGTNLQWTTDGFTNSYNFATTSVVTLSASTTAGINIANSEIAVIVSTTLGMSFGPDGRLYQQVSSTLALANTSTGTYIVTSTLRSLIATSTVLADRIPISDSVGSLNNWVSTTPALVFASSSIPKTVNAVDTENTFFTYQLVMIPSSTAQNVNTPSSNWMNCAKNFVGNVSVRKMGGFASTTWALNDSFACQLFSSSSEYAYFNDPNTTTIKWRMRVFSGVGSTEDVQIGVATGTPVQDTNGNINPFELVSTTASAARAVFNIGGTNGVLSSITANGSAVTKNVITGITTSNWNTYVISYSSTTVQFFVNGALRFTHTTNLPSTGIIQPVHFGFGSSNDAVVGMQFTDPIVSMKL